MFVEKGDACLTVAGARPLFWEAQKDPEVKLSQRGISKRERLLPCKLGQGKKKKKKEGLDFVTEQRL